MSDKNRRDPSAVPPSSVGQRTAPNQPVPPNRLSASAITTLLILLYVLVVGVSLEIISRGAEYLGISTHISAQSPLIWMALSAMAVGGCVALGLQVRRYRYRLEQVNAENTKAVHEHDEYVHGLFIENPSVTLLIDPASGDIADANNAAVTFYGYPRARLLKMSIDEVNVLAPARLAEARRNAMRRSRTFFEFPHRLASGEIRDVEVFVTPIVSDGRDLLLSVIHDISAHKQAQRALRESEQRLRIAGRASYDVIYEWDPASGNLTWFGDIDTMLGFAYGEMRAENRWKALIHPEDEQIVQNAIACRKRNPETCVVEYRVATQSGEYRSWLDKSSPLLDENGSAYKWVGVCTDVTERKRSEEELRLAAAVFQHAQESIIIADAKRNIVDVNDAFTAISGYSREEVIGRNPRFLNSGRQDGAFYQRMWQTIDKTGRWFGEIWNRRKNGELFAELLSISAILDNNGVVQNYVALASDITEHKAH